MLKKNKIVTSFLIVSVFLIGTLALTANPATASVDKVEKQNVDATIALVLSTGGLGDFGFNDLAYAGYQRALANHDIDGVYVEPDTTDEIGTYIEQFATSTTKDYDLIIAIGFSSFSFVNQSAAAHPDQNFMILDFDLGFAGHDNVVSTTFLEHEGSFLVGAMAALTTKSNTVGFLGGELGPLIGKFEAGYEQGAKYVTPDITVLSQYAPDQSNPWTDQAGGKTVANNFIEQGADVIYAAAGGTGFGIFDAVKEARADNKTVYAIGVDADQDGLEPGAILASMVKRVDVAVEYQIEKLISTGTPVDLLNQGLDNIVNTTTFPAGTSMIDISNMTYTPTERNLVCDKCGGKSRYDFVQDLKQKVIDGDIVVSSTTAEPASPGFDSSIAIIGLAAVAIVPVIRKRRK
jgi:basic membrane protein A